MDHKRKSSQKPRQKSSPARR